LYRLARVFRQASKRFLSLSKSDGFADFIKSLLEKDI
jgi:hypothetical protein